MECLKYLHEHGCAWDKSACEAAAQGDVMRAYYDVNDFLAREHAVEVEFASGASTIAPEVLGTRATRDSNGRADVPKEHRALVPLWWLDGEMANDVWVCSTPAAFKDPP